MPLVFNDDIPMGFVGDMFVFSMRDEQTGETVSCEITRDGLQRAIQKKEVYDPRIAFSMYKARFGELASERFDEGQRPPRITIEDVEAF